MVVTVKQGVRFRAFSITKNANKPDQPSDAHTNVQGKHTCDWLFTAVYPPMSARHFER